MLRWGIKGWRSAPCRHDSAFCRLMKPGRTSQQQGARWTPCSGSRRASCAGHDLARQARYSTNEETAEVHAVGEWLFMRAAVKGVAARGLLCSQVMQAGALCCSALEQCIPDQTLDRVHWLSACSGGHSARQPLTYVSVYAAGEYGWPGAWASGGE